jgi:hypothetical protein
MVAIITDKAKEINVIFFHEPVAGYNIAFRVLILKGRSESHPPA